MSLYIENDFYKLYHGKMQDELANLSDGSIDAIITDPPYELNFMNKGWDNSGVAFQKETWEHTFRVLKDGGYLIAFGGTRTYHRIACAIEDAGFEIRDCIMWLYGSGFPKSMNIGLAIDKKNGVESEIIGNGKSGCSSRAYQSEETTTAGSYEIKQAVNEWKGFGTALKPAYEPIIVARKPFKGSLVENIIKNRVGGINIDECRVQYINEKDYLGTKVGFKEGSTDKDYTNIGKGFRVSPLKTDNGFSTTGHNGRFPSNVILTYDETDKDEVCGGMPDTKGNGNIRHNNNKKTQKLRLENGSQIYGGYNNCVTKGYEDEGSASRYFYTAKASKKDRDEGLDEFEDGNITDGRKAISDRPYLRQETFRKNTHPTVKPTDLMQYLVRMFAPKGATILDPFMGSGSTGKAVAFENRERDANYKFIGIEMTDEYLPIAQARINFASGYVYDKKTETKTKLSLFDFI